MTHQEERIRIILEQLWKNRSLPAGEIGPVEYVYAGYKENDCPPAEGWQLAAPHQRYEGYDGHVWLRAHFHTPAARPHCRLVLTCDTGRSGNGCMNPQSLLYLNGEIAQGFDVNHTEAVLAPDTDYDLLNYFYLSLEPGSVECELTLSYVEERTEHLWYDLAVMLDTAVITEPDSADYRAILKHMTAAVNLLDLREPQSDAYSASVEKAIDYLYTEFYGKVCTPEGKPIVTCIGHTHIDVEWKWNRYQTMEKVQRSFSTALALMRRFPEYKFMLSQPNLYQYLKATAPQKYEELKQRIREGRWEPEGAMYLEADCNLVSGESFVRQLMHGKRFFREEFGKENYILFLPDVFGYSAALPQILRKSGIRHFVTSKISWNDTNTMPVDTFLWQGIDGTEIFTNFITTQKYAPVPARTTTYNGKLTPSEIKGTWHKYLQKDYANRQFTTFGFGDGGGGPTEKMLEVQRRLAYGLPGMPVTETGLLLPHLDKVREQFDRACLEKKETPRWVGELYLEFHRGTYTSIAKNKRNNRKSEFLLQKLETLSYTDLLFGGAYDEKGLWDHWEKVLHNQFHDIIPGSSIKSVYDLTDRDYAEINAYGDRVKAEKAASLAARIGSDGGVLVYNALGFPVRGTVTVDGETRETPEIPAFGWRVIPDTPAVCDVAVSGRTAENRLYRLTVDEAGRIVELFDKAAQRNVLLPGQTANELQAFEDLPRVYDNWEISEYYTQKQWTLDTPCTVEPIYDGARAGFAIRRTYLQSEIRQKIWLYSEREGIDIETELDWHEHHQILKAAFPLDLNTDTATFEIQYGHVTRPIHRNTSWDKARFEVYGHKWLDLSEYGYGVGILNDSKYGCSIEGTTVKVTMLKCGTFPNPEADQGLHRFTYTLLPHTGDFRAAGVVQAAYRLNQPLSAVRIAPHGGDLADCFSLASVDADNVILEVVKKAEDGDDMIVRAYDAYRARRTVHLSVAPGFTKAYLCDLMENNLAELPFDGQTATLAVKPFEIVTVRFTRS